MPKIRIINSTETDASAELAELRKPLSLDRLILDEVPEAKIVRQIISDVRQRGDQAVAEITARVDKVDIPPDSIRVPPELIIKAHDQMPQDLHKAVQHSIESVRRFQESLLTAHHVPLQINGRILSSRTRPVARVGVCVPGAAAPLPSSAVHSAVPAQVAGVKEVAIIAPPLHNGDIHPTILGVAGELGIHEVYRMGGAHGVAALAIGTERVNKVDKIVGPGGPYVQLAKRYLYGVVDIDMYAATTEVVVIADASAKPDFIAADMIAQAEHNPGSSIVITDQSDLPDKILAELDKQLAELPAAEATARWLNELGAIVIVKNMDEAAKLTDEIAPEHLQIETENANQLADKIDSAGAIFLGHYTPESVGDYVAGPSHVLPTGGTAHFWSGVSALSFLRHTSIMEYTPGGLAHDANSIETLARAEGLNGHALAITVRTRRR
ncbi:MAG: histidinol dehydrogenase [Planctomycetota bacterium]|nr:MAG: histidinol dehydrogenase [Planctomycetota bacterium]